MWPEPAGEPPQAGAAPHTPPAGRAVPSLGPFAELLGQPYQRLKVAVLRELAGLDRPSWPLAEAERALTWLEPVTATRLLSELRADGLLVEAGRPAGVPGEPTAWRLSDEAQLVAAVCAILAAPRVPPERAVKVLGAAMALARAAGADERATYGPFVAATSVLERHLDTMVRLIDEGAEDALPEAIRLARTHLTDMRALLEQAGGGQAHPAERRAALAADRLQTLAGEVEAGLAGDGPDRDVGGRAGQVPSAAELRELIAATDVATLAGLVAAPLQLPPAIPPVRAGAALAALDEHLGRPEPVVVPLPEPTLLPIESPEVVPDFVLLAADVMTWLAGLGESDLARWVVGGTWAEATARMAAAVEAWSRWGPAGDGSLAAELDPRPRFEVVGHDEVGVISVTGVRIPAARGPHHAQPEEPQPAPVGAGGDETPS
jgi:hypothetical protein